jgi:small-conductance mechanosensitive channel
LPWYHYVAAFFAGAFLTNVVPHFVNGISGEPFPTPFSKPPGKGLSSPTVNVVWALFNLLIGYALFEAGQLSSGDRVTLLVFFAGIAAISIMCSANFAKKHSK